MHILELQTFKSMQLGEEACFFHRAKSMMYTKSSLEAGSQADS